MADFRKEAERLQGNAQRDLGFNALADLWLTSIRSQMKKASYTCRVSSLNPMKPFSKNAKVRSISVSDID